MTTEPRQSPNPTAREEKLHQLVHDVRAPLSVISMGLEALSTVRANPNDFNEVYEAIQQNGMGPLKEMMNRLIEVACQPENEK